MYSISYIKDLFTLGINHAFFVTGLQVVNAEYRCKWGLKPVLTRTQATTDGGSQKRM